MKGIEVKGTDVKLWRNERTSSGASWTEYNLSISKKNQDGTYTNSSVRAKFARSVDVPVNLRTGTNISFEGFLTPDNYVGKDGKEVKRVMIMIMKAEFPEAGQKNSYGEVDGFEQLEEDIPF